MNRFSIRPFLMAAAITFGQLVAASAQEPQPASTPTDEQQQKEKAEREKKALILLDQILNDAQLLKLPENRINLQINTADLIWDRNQARARTLFTSAADSIAEMMRTTEQTEQRRGGNQPRIGAQLRQQLIFAVARHDGALAYQLLATTRPVTPAASEPRNPYRPDDDENLEQALLARIAALDPKMALQNAEQFLDKGQFPRSLTGVLTQLQRKDKEAAAKLEDKLLKRLQSANMLASVDASGLALGLLRPGPPPAAPATTTESTESTPPPDANQPAQFLAQSGYVDLLGTVIDAALKATPQNTASNPRPNPRFRGAGGGQNNLPTAPTDAQIEQNNARALLNGLQVMLPQVDQYLPTRAQAVRDKLTEMGMANSPRASMNQMVNLMRQGSAESLLSAAPTAPPQMQTRLYQQAALKALDEGNADRARQIASDHLDGTTRDSVLRQVEFRQISEKTDASRLDELRQTLASLRSDDERVDLLIQLSTSSKQKDPKLAVQLLDQAKQLTSRRAVNYQQFEQQLRVAEAFRELEPGRSFEVLEPGIVQLNDLLSAAATLSGFEVTVFKDGELPLEARSNLGSLVTRYGQALGALAKIDFERAQALANRFQLTEPRILARLSIVQGLLGTQPLGRANIRGVESFRPQ